MNLYQINSDGVYTGATMELDDTAGAPVGWIDAVPPAVTDGSVAVWTGTAWTTQLAPPAPARTIPASVSMRQARLALLQAGKLSSVDTAIAALDDPQKSEAQIEWQYAGTVERNSSLVATLGAALGFGAEDLDNLFITASAL